jgi:hypothetical protein
MIERFLVKVRYQTPVSLEWVSDNVFVHAHDSDEAVRKVRRRLKCKMPDVKLMLIGLVTAYPLDDDTEPDLL